MVALLSAELRASDRLHAKRPPTEVRELETTAYVRPSHQRVGYAPEATALVSAFLEMRFQVNRRIVMIRWDNVEVQARAVKAGLSKLAGQTPQGYETWLVYDRVD